MPNRFLYEKICISESVDDLSWFEECFFYRLIVNCDDYGRFYARPAILKSRLFPLKSGITEKVIENCLNKLSSVGLVKVYMYDFKPYLQLVTWGKYQQTRAKESKFPEPPKNDNFNAHDNTCNQMISDDIKCKQMSSYSNAIFDKSNSIYDYCAEPQKNAPSAQQDIAISMPLSGKTGEFYVTKELVEQWAELYPAVDILQTLRDMKGWLLANPTKRKTKNGILRFINNWLAKEQNKGGNRSNSKFPQQREDHKPDENYIRQVKEYQRNKRGTESAQTN